MIDVLKKSNSSFRLFPFAPLNGIIRNQVQVKCYGRVPLCCKISNDLWEENKRILRLQVTFYRQININVCITRAREIISICEIST